MSVSGYSSQQKFEKTIEEAQNLLYRPRITDEEIQTAINRIKDSIARSQDTAHSIYSDYNVQFNPAYYSKKEVLKDIDSVTVDDVRKLHNYVLNNSVGYITVNTPSSNKDMENVTVQQFENLKPVKPFKYETLDYYNTNAEPVVLVKDRQVSQADIIQVHKFKFDDTAKDLALLKIMNTILSSSSIGLFNTLREKEHLAYSVHSKTSVMGNSGEIFCNIFKILISS